MRLWVNNRELIIGYLLDNYRILFNGLVVFLAAYLIVMIIPEKSWSLPTVTSSWPDRLRRYISGLEVIPRALVLASYRLCKLLDRWLRVALCQELARLLMFLHHLANHSVVRVLLLLCLRMMKIGPRRVLIECDYFLRHRWVPLRDLLLLLRIHIVEVDCWSTADVLDMHWAMTVSRLTLIIVDCSCIAALFL